MAGTKRDYSQFLQTTRKVNISELLAPNKAPRPLSAPASAAAPAPSPTLASASAPAFALAALHYKEPSYHEPPRYSAPHDIPAPPWADDDSYAESLPPPPYMEDNQDDCYDLPQVPSQHIAPGAKAEAGAKTEAGAKAVAPAPAFAPVATAAAADTKAAPQVQDANPLPKSQDRAPENKKKAPPQDLSPDHELQEFAAILALPQKFYLRALERFKAKGVANPEKAAAAYTTMHPSADLGDYDDINVSEEESVVAAEDTTKEDKAKERNCATAAGDTLKELSLQAKSAGWVGAWRYQGNFAERFGAIMSELELQVESIEDRPFQKLCSLSEGRRKFKLSVFYRETGLISYVQTSGLSAKAKQAVRLMEDFIGCNIKELPQAENLEEAKLEAQLQAGLSRKRKKRTLSERNSRLKLTSAQVAARVVQEGKVQIEALAAEGKGKLLTIGARLELILHSFDRSLELKELPGGQYRYDFSVHHPSGYNFTLRIFHKKTDLISRVQVLNQAGLSLLQQSVVAQIEEACAQSLVGTGVKILVKPGSVHVDSAHLLTLQEVRF